VDEKPGQVGLRGRAGVLAAVARVGGVRRDHPRGVSRQLALDGLHGNTLWNWLHPLLLPLLVPVVIVPALTQVATARVEMLDETEGAEPGAGSGSDAGPTPGRAADAGPAMRPDPERAEPA
jgi:hypothetical protein